MELALALKWEGAFPIERASGGGPQTHVLQASGNGLVQGRRGQERTQPTLFSRRGGLRQARPCRQGSGDFCLLSVEPVLLPVLHIFESVLRHSRTVEQSSSLFSSLSSLVFPFVFFVSKIFSFLFALPFSLSFPCVLPSGKLHNCRYPSNIFDWGDYCVRTRPVPRFGRSYRGLLLNRQGTGQPANPLGMLVSDRSDLTPAYYSSFFTGVGDLGHSESVPRQAIRYGNDTYAERATNVALPWAVSRSCRRAPVSGTLSFILIVSPALGTSGPVPYRAQVRVSGRVLFQVPLTWAFCLFSAMLAIAGDAQPPRRRPEMPDSLVWGDGSTNETTRKQDTTKIAGKWPMLARWLKLRCVGQWGDAAASLAQSCSSASGPLAYAELCR